MRVVKEKILRVLKEAKGQYTSGEKLSDALGCHEPPYGNTSIPSGRRVMTSFLYLERGTF